MTQAAAPSSGRQWELLGNRNFVLLWCAYGISALGDHLSEMAILKTQNAASTDVDVTPLDARMTFLFFVPFFLLAPLTGWLADRLPRRGLMITADAVRCAAMLSFLVLMGWTANWGSWGPFLPLLLVGAFAALFSPARSALLPTLIRPEQLVRANGMISGLGVIATMVAIQIGGYLADHHHPEVAFRLDAGTFLASAVLLWCLRAPPQRTRRGGEGGLAEGLREIAAGFRYVSGHRRVLELIVIAALVWFCGPLVKCVIPAVVRDAYGYAENYQAMSTYRAFLGIGFILGAVSITTLGNALRSEIAITWGLLGIAISMSIFAASVFVPLAFFTRAVIGAIGVVLGGLFGVVVLASFNALLQRIVPDRYRGRVFGVKDLACTGALLLATGLLGVPRWTRLDDWVGFILIGVALLAFFAWAVNLRARLARHPLPSAVVFWVNLNEFVAKLWWRLERIGPVTIPRTGAVIVTANHTCSADPLFLYAAAPRHRILSFMVAAEYTNMPLGGSLMRLVDCIPVRRGEYDTSATKQAIRYLRAGKAMGIFIEGRTVRPGEAAEPKDGVAMLALRTGAKVIPAHISGVKYRAGILRGLLARHDVRVHFGPPVDLSDLRGSKPDRAVLREATRKIYAAVRSLAPPGATAPPPGDDTPYSSATEAPHEPS
jgi:1-acyl-sn-glycerol-3-phosphate acyltransferase